MLRPLFVAVAVAIKLDSRGPVFFRQVRMGRGDRTFRMLKFRTMVVDADARKGEVAHLNKHAGGDERMFKAPNDPRVTRVGRVLRRYSLDELPQLVNVLQGEMSLVGPRPLILEEHRHVGGWGRERLDLKPGITGLWQVLGATTSRSARWSSSTPVRDDVVTVRRPAPHVANRPGGAQRSGRLPVAGVRAQPFGVRLRVF